MRAWAACVLLIFAWPKGLRAVQSPAHALRPVDVVLSAAAVGMYAAPHVFTINEHATSCAPCDRQGVPWFDRWAITEPKSTASAVSTGLVLALAGLETLDLARGGPAHYGEIVYVAQSAGWALGASEVIKAAAARKRPVLYTAEAQVEAVNLDAQRSLPSSHAAVAAALATAYVLVPRGRPQPAWRRWAALAAAASVGVLRVAAGKHFPSDVVGGAALGVVSAIGVRAIRF